MKKNKTIKVPSQAQQEAKIEKRIAKREKDEELAIAVVGYIKLPELEPIDHLRDLFPTPRFGIWLSAEECFFRH